MENISEHISYLEAVYSGTAKRNNLKNVPDEKQLERMRVLASNIFEPLRNHFGVRIYISSFFRSAEVNKVVGGSEYSQHVMGEAMDLDAELYGGITNKQIYDFIKDNLDFDQLIWEYGTDEEPEWIHVSYTTRRPNRKQLIRIK